MSDSILTSVKKVLNIDESDTAFDVDVIMHVNSVFSVLHQMGIGPDTAFSISGSDETWDDFLQSNKDLEMIKSYMYLKVRLLFDPPSSSVVMQSFSEIAKEYEWRLYAYFNEGE